MSPSLLPAQRRTQHILFRCRHLGRYMPILQCTFWFVQHRPNHICKHHLSQALCKMCTKRTHGKSSSPLADCPEHCQIALHTHCPRGNCEYLSRYFAPSRKSPQHNCPRLWTPLQRSHRRRFVGKTPFQSSQPQQVHSQTGATLGTNTATTLNIHHRLSS